MASFNHEVDVDIDIDVEEYFEEMSNEEKKAMLDMLLEWEEAQQPQRGNECLSAPHSEFISHVETIRSSYFRLNLTDERTIEDIANKYA